MLSSSKQYDSLGNSGSLMISHSCLTSRLGIGRKCIQDTARHLSNMTIQFIYTHDSEVQMCCVSYFVDRNLKRIDCVTVSSLFKKLTVLYVCFVLFFKFFPAVKSLKLKALVFLKSW